MCITCTPWNPLFLKEEEEEEEAGVIKKL